MKVAIAQMNTTPGDFDAIVDKMCSYDTVAHAYGADLIVFPSTVMMGCDPLSLAQCPGYVLDFSSAMGALSERLRTPAIVPFVAGGLGQSMPEAALIRNGSVLPLSIAGAVSNVGQAKPGTAASALSGSPAVVSIAGASVGVTYTFDELELFASGSLPADVICFVPFEGYDVDEQATCFAPSVSDGCFVEEAKGADAWIVAANAVGAFGDLAFVGGSFVMAPWGELAAASRCFAEDVFVCDIDVKGEGPLANPVAPPAFDRERILWDACVLATRDRCDKQGLSGVAVVCDGSLSSSVTCAIAVDAVGPMRVHALVCGTGEELEDARGVVRALKIRDVDELAARDVERAAVALGGNETEDLARGLVEARLGAWARAGELLTLSSADKTELAVGSSSFDPAPAARAAAFAPLGDIYRSDVMRLARYRNTASPVICPRAAQRLCVPADLGLEGIAETDEQCLSELDASLLARFEHNYGLTELAQGRLGEEGAARLLERVRACELARRHGPLYPLLSSRSLSEAQVPLMDAWRDRMRPEPLRMPDEGELTRAVVGAAHDLGVYDAAAKMDAPATPPAPAASPSLATPNTPASASAIAFMADDPGVPKASMRSRVNEALGYLQELSDGKRMREGLGGDKGGQGGGIWPDGFFSDN